MSQVEVLNSIGELFSEDLDTRLKAENALWIQQYNDSYIKALSQIILDDDANVTPKLKKTCVIAFRKVFSSRWRQSMNFHGEPTDDLKELIRNEFYEIVSSEKPEEIKSIAKNILLDVYNEIWIDVWFLEELIQKSERSEKIFFELLFHATAFHSHCDHTPENYEGVYKKLAELFRSLIKKYLTSLPDYLEELQLLLRCYSRFVFANVTEYLYDDISYFVEHLQEFILQYPINIITLNQKQTKALLAAKEETLLFWSSMHYDETRFIQKNLHSLFNVAISCMKTIPGSHEYDGIYFASKELIQKLLIFYLPELNFQKENIDQLFDCMIQSCLKSSDMEEAELCIQEPLKYAKYILDRDSFAIHNFFSTSKRRNHFYNFVDEMIFREEFVPSICDYLEKSCLKSAQYILDKDFYWNIVTSLNNDGDDESYENRKSYSKHLPLKIADMYNDAIQLLTSDEAVHPLLQCDALKFILLQRKQFSIENLNGCLDILIDLLTSQHLSVVSLAACALQRIIYLKDDDFNPIINDDILLQKFPKLLENVRKSLSIQGNGGNEFVMNALKQALSNLSVKLISIPEDLMIFLREQIFIIAEAECVDKEFSVNLFECVGHLGQISVNRKENDKGKMADDFKAIFVPVFKEVLKRKHKDIVPYITYIILNTLLPCYKSSPTDDLQDFISKLLICDLWYNDECTASLAYSLKVFIRTCHNMIDPPTLESILEICYNLLLSQPMAYHSFQIFISILESLEGHESHLPLMLGNSIKASEINKEFSFIKGLIVFMFYAVHKCGADKILKLLLELNPSFFKNFVIQIVFPLSCHATHVSDHNITAIGLSLLLDYLVPWAIKEEESMILWTYLIMTLADVCIGIPSGNPIGSRNSDGVYRSFEKSLLYDYLSEFAPDKGQCDQTICPCENHNKIYIGIAKLLKETLEKYPQLCSSDKFSSLNFSLEIRNKLKFYVKKCDLPSFPHLTYPDDPEEQERDYECSWCLEHEIQPIDEA